MGALALRLVFAALGAVPAVVMMLLVDRLDRTRAEPRWLLRRVALLGALTIVPVLGLELAMVVAGLPARGHDLGTGVLASFVVAALPEEAGKALCLRWLMRHRVEFDERIDGIVYGARAGLGFALVENMTYSLTAKDVHEFVALFVARACLSVPNHATYAAVMGYFAARRHLDGVGPGLVGGLAIAVLGHGLFDLGLTLAMLGDDTADAAGFLLGVAITLGAAATGILAVIALARRARALDLRDALAAASAERS